MIMGYLRVFKGDICWKRKKINHMRPDERVKLGLSYMPQLENIFPTLSVHENLEMGGYLLSNVKDRIEEIYNIFLVLKEREKQKSAILSDGER